MKKNVSKKMYKTNYNKDVHSLDSCFKRSGETYLVSQVLYDLFEVNKNADE